MVRRYPVTSAVCAGALLLAPTTVAAGGLAQEPVVVSSERGSAPVVEPGAHLLDLRDDGWLEVRRDSPDATVWVGESVVTPRANNGEHRISVRDDDGDCSWTDEGWMGEEAVQVQLRGGGNATDDCAGKSVWVKHELLPSANYVDTPLTLAVWEEPPATVEGLPDPSTEVAWNGSALDVEVVDAELGDGFAAAPDLDEGRYLVRSAVEAPNLFAVDLDWGQHLQVEMSHEEGHTEDAPLVRPRLINPLGITTPWATTLTSQSGTPPPDPFLLSSPGTAKRGGVVSPTIRWRNREEPDNAAAFPGRYYVALDMEDDGRHPDSTGTEFQLTVRVIDDEEPVSPYDEEPSALPDLAADLTADDGEPAESSPSTSRDGAAGTTQDDDRPWPVVIGLLAGSLVLAAAGALLLGRWRRGVMG